MGRGSPARIGHVAPALCAFERSYSKRLIEPVRAPPRGAGPTGRGPCQGGHGVSVRLRSFATFLGSPMKALVTVSTPLLLYRAAVAGVLVLALAACRAGGEAAAPGGGRGGGPPM